MESVVKQRIKEIASFKKMSITALSKAINVPQPTLNRQINTDAPITLSNILLILNLFPDISSEWLLRGEGSMHKTENEEVNKGPHSHHVSSQRYETMLNLLAEVTEDLKETVIENQKLYEEIEELKTKLKMPQSA